ncbi:MAG: M3 family metallopeptidase [Deltaproteobacteria bacterium]|nr:M3 family metallopeptidase [Deltaproteobacteria bacterium]MBN2670952.1 M3 family metallopeptidase [Deltaproteobacteria bacterium]
MKFVQPVITVLLSATFASCGSAPTQTKETATLTTKRIEQKSEPSSPPPQNPLLAEFNTPFSVPPFTEITDDDYEPAFEEAMRIHDAEVAEIADAKVSPTFDNTVAALDYSGALLTKVALVFFAKQSADTNDKVQEVAKTVAPKLSAHADRISMNPRLFAKIQRIYQERESLELSPEQQRLLELTYKDFVRGGALLSDDDKKKLTEINGRLSVLSVQFGDHLLAENNEFKLIIENEKELAGLPKAVIDAAAEKAAQEGKEGKWKFTLHKPSWIPFMQYAEHREHRKTMFSGYTEKGNHNDKNDNKATLLEMVTLRLERAKLLGYPTHANYILEMNMAQTPNKVDELLQKLWNGALPAAEKELKALKKVFRKDYPKEQFMAWDWFYYTEKLRAEKYDLNENELRPYFRLENVQQGAFDVASKLFGLQFEKRTDLPIYSDDVTTFEVKSAEGDHVGLLYLDYFPRPGKQQGAWMTEFRGQEKRDGAMIHPVIVNVFNFPRPTKDAPSLLSLEEVETLFHEFGHGLHGLLSNVTYPSLSGTNVPRDFVELPSQFMENWAVEKEVLTTYAKHYQTGEIIPDALIKKLEAASHFNQGFETVEYLAASFLDMKWHTLTEAPSDIDVNEFEDNALSDIHLPDEIVSRYRSPYFAHIFSGGYSSGYYSYIWSAVLDSDAFAAFKEQRTLFDTATAAAYRDNILTRGNTADPIELYKKFRGKEPSIEPLLEKRGLK